MGNILVSRIFSWSFTVFFACMLLPTSLAARESGLLLYVGSSTIGKYMHAASRRYHRNTLVIKTMMESSGGEKWVAHGRADIGGVARTVKQKYLDMGVVPTLIGKDGMGVLVHADNPVRDLSMAQLRGIFSGTIKNWRTLGGGNYPIHLYLVSADSATFSVFKQVVLQGKRYAQHETVSPDAVVITKVRADLGGIGVLSLALLIDSKRVRSVAVNGQKASLNNPDYPITRPLYLTTRGVPQGKTKAFIDWTLSTQGQRLLQHYFIGVATQQATRGNVNPLIQSAKGANE
ncbi:MAG: substrate-binding domain-containing protein [Mariprofundaceae bacterium]|nr:substrate-binding domain-containing protein [Mariprofundaceae bacterium]